MRLTFGIVWAASLLGVGLGRPATEVLSRDSALAYYDQETGFTFSEFKAAYSLTANIVFRVAVPTNVPSGQAYDIVLQVVAPTQVGWLGLAWGGNMVKNPLTVGWSGGSKPVISSRWATGHSTPAMYTGATFQTFTTGNRVNSTHWQFTAKCTGCTSFTGSGGATRLNPTGSSRFAFAYAGAKPSSPSSNTSSLPMHDINGYWSHDFSVGQNPDFASLVVRNGGTA